MVGLLNKVHENWQEESLLHWQKRSFAQANSALQAWQEGALRRFLAIGFPSKKNEAWKYTNLSALAAQEFSMADTTLATVDLTQNQLGDVYRLVFINGQFSADQSQMGDAIAGVDLLDLDSALQQGLVSQADLQLNDKGEAAFTALNAGLLSNGLFLRVGANIRVQKPIHILYLNTSSGVKKMNHPRHLIIAEQGAEVTVFEEYASADSSHFNNIVTQIFASEGANVSHYKLQNESHTAFHIANTLIQQKRDSTVSTYHFSLGAKLARDNLNYYLNEPGVSCRMIGFYHGVGQQHVDQHTHVDHLVPNTASEQVYKGIVHDKARAVFNGKVIVHPDAQQTVAHQANKNLLLSKQAEVDTKPELEIYADDVKCSHGATIGQLDSKALFYLRSRGIAADKARHMLTSAFATELLDAIPNALLQAYFKDAVVKCLSASEGGCYE